MKDFRGQPPATAGGSDTKLERAVRLELTNTGFAIRSLGRLATRAEEQSAKSKGLRPWVFALCSLLFALGSLERKERFELSNRVWKTRMFPATSLPQLLECAGRVPTCRDADGALDFGVRTKSR